MKKPMSFWKAAALLVVGGYVALEANKYLKNKLFPTTSEEVDEVEVKPKVQNTKKTSKEIEEIKELIKEYESKKYKTKRELGILDLLRFKLNQLEKEL